MARTRMIKPEFWSDEKLALLSLQARLTYIGLWNLSDDYGVVKGHPSWLKNSIYPYDDLRLGQFEAWLSELERIGRIVPFVADGEKFYCIRNFRRHQTINRPSQIRNPDVPLSLMEGSLSAHGALTDETETETETERETETTTAADDKNRPPPKEDVKQEDKADLPAPDAGRHQPKPVARVSSPVKRKIEFDYETGHFRHVLSELVEKWQQAYPAVDVLSELRRMETWAVANPVHRKSNWQRFIVNWLTRSQDRAVRGGPNGPPEGEGSLDRWLKKHSTTS
jgi:hypothetical protein